MSIKLKICEITQQTKYLTEENIKRGLDRQCIKKYAYILHDKDVDEKGNLKEPHWHIMMQFSDTQDSKYIAKWFGIEEQYVSSAKSKSKGERKRFDDMLSYLIHLNDKTKYAYPYDAVTANFDFKQFILDKGKTSRLTEIINMIDEGIIREFNYNKYVSSNEYVRYHKQMENAFQYRRDRIYTGSRELDVIFITGNSGCGKTAFAKWLAEKKGLPFFVTGSGEDFMDGYKGQDCLILDDIRGSSMKFSEFIKLCDNHTDSNVKSRYKNKYLTECKLLIITSVFGVDDFYKNVFQESDEPIVQFKRRCTMYLKMNDLNISVYQYDKGCCDYTYSGEFENPITEIIPPTKGTKTEEELSEYFCLKPVVHEELITPPWLK